MLNSSSPSGLLTVKAYKHPENAQKFTNLNNWKIFIAFWDNASCINPGGYYYLLLEPRPDNTYFIINAVPV